MNNYQVPEVLEILFLFDILFCDGRRCQFWYIILSRVRRLGIILLMHRTGRFPKLANHHCHAISEQSWG